MKTTQEKIAVMQAFADGKKIEARNKKVQAESGWHVVDPIWNWYNCDYRVAEDMEQKALDIYYKAGNFTFTATLHEAVRPAWRAVIDAVKRGEIS